MKNVYKCLVGEYKGRLFEWSDVEHEYVTKSLPWFITPLIEKSEMISYVKKGWFEKVAPIKPD